MSRRAPTAALCVLAVTITTACASSPEPSFYALAPTPGATQPPAPRTIRIRRPGIAGYLDRPEIVHRVADFRLGVASDERWGEPLDAMLGRVIAEDVEQRLPGSSVYTQDGAITADTDTTVEVDVRRFDIGGAGEVNLVAEVAVEHGDGHGPAASHPVTLKETPKTTTTAGLVATMSDLLGQLADQIAAMLRAG